ncbi:MAG: hypothetical protein V9E94_04215 [Microthrixaceae bacterium]
MAELCMALVNGMFDYSAARVDKAYSTRDVEFPERDAVARRLDRVFDSIVSLDASAIKDTIFSRSPVFYSLVLVLDARSRQPAKRTLEQIIWEIDSRFNDSRPASERPEEDVAFVAACTASTQRIRSRRIRADYIASFF